ncbi:alpha-E domain-containing protein [Acidithiobacillus sp. AC3]
MLSRVAENLYWMARYLERAEDLGRFINSATLLLLDLPLGTRFGWDILLQITGEAQRFQQHYGQPNEKAIMRFLIADSRNPSSLLSCVHQARENCRTFRDLLPGEFWERINSLFLYVQDGLEKENIAEDRRARLDFLENVIARRHALVGLLVGSMSQNAAYQFIKLGRNIERADMGSRIVDVVSAVIPPEDQGMRRTVYQSLWVGVLRAMSALEMYRQHVGVQVRSARAVEFLLRDSKCPRSVRSCLTDMELALAYLPNAGIPAEALRRTRRRLDQLQLKELTPAVLHEYLDQVQRDLGVLHHSIENAYFRVREANDPYPHPSPQRFALQA